jgi:aryl-alcohol dehydrogenase-like predicted oxidoreductase
METRPLGPFDVSIVGLGCNNFGRRIDADATRIVVQAALDAGITFFDTADVYGDGESEAFLGRALAGRRDEAIVATKFGLTMPDGSGGAPLWIRTAVEDSLRRLDIDHIDLYQFHAPDDETPIAETLGALGELVAAGKVRTIGCSNVTVDQLEEALGTSAEGELPAWVSVQNHYSLLHREPEDDGILDACDRHGLGLLPFFPLASGVLTGKYRPGAAPPEGTRLATIPAERAERFLNADSLDAAARLEQFAAERGHSLLELAFGYLLAADPVASVIAGATRPEQIAANAAAAGWRLTTEERAEAQALATTGS